MRHTALALLVAAAIPALPAAAQQSTPSQSMKVPATHQEALKDIEATLGMVPSFFRSMPDAALPGAWATMKSVQLNPNSEIPAKNKELIGLAVAAQIPCNYCVYFHTQVAKLHGATEAEIEQTVAEASLTRFMSTWLNGSKPDMAQFRKEMASIASRMQRQATAGTTGTGRTMPITDAASARKDIEQTFGTMPTFLSRLPDDVLPGVWSQWKAIEMAGGPIPEKYLMLTSLAVASQIPCDYCVEADTAFSQASGATAREQQEAILLASTVRQWSTVLNGTRPDEAKFRKEVDQMVKTLRNKQPASRQPTNR